MQQLQSSKKHAAPLGGFQRADHIFSSTLNTSSGTTNSEEYYRQKHGLVIKQSALYQVQSIPASDIHYRPLSGHVGVALDFETHTHIKYYVKGFSANEEVRARRELNTLLRLAPDPCVVRPIHICSASPMLFYTFNFRNNVGSVRNYICKGVSKERATMLNLQGRWTGYTGVKKEALKKL